METLATPRARRWTRAGYDRLIDLGVFAPGERLELIDGVLVVREPQGSRHAAAIRRVLAALRRALDDAWQIDSQLPIALDEATEVEPDVAVVPSDPRHYRDAHPSGAAVIVEVADSSSLIDRESKMSLYARAGIPECWIIDLARDTLEVHREPEPSAGAPHGWRYGHVQTLRTPAGIAPLIAPTTVVLVADLLP